MRPRGRWTLEAGGSESDGEEGNEVPGQQGPSGEEVSGAPRHEVGGPVHLAASGHLDEAGAGDPGRERSAGEPGCEEEESEAAARVRGEVIP